MRGPEHYVEAERLLEMADRYVSIDYETQIGERKADVIAAAQVHATLALAAATALGSSGIPQDGDTAREWRTMLVAPKANRPPSDPRILP